MSLLILSKREDKIITAFLTEVELMPMDSLTFFDKGKLFHLQGLCSNQSKYIAGVKSGNIDSIPDYEFRQFLIYEDHYAQIYTGNSLYGTYEFKLDNLIAIGNECNPEMAKDMAISVASKDVVTKDVISNIISEKAWWGLFGAAEECSFRLSEWNDKGELVSNDIRRLKLRWINT
tara:strand:- start:27 stop:551 length:525 start_codon:yes stop_codon:yes gene_type:complete